MKIDLPADDVEFIIATVGSSLSRIKLMVIANDTPADHRQTLLKVSIPAHKALLKRIADQMSPTKKDKLYNRYYLDQGVHQ